MTEQEKSLKLAELMGWEVGPDGKGNVVFYEVEDFGGCGSRLQPYAHYEDGLAQFAAILLKFPDVMQGIDYEWHAYPAEARQRVILDEILRMNGVDV